MRSYQPLLAELKRRKVFKVAAVYGATAFVLLQAAEILGQGLRLPESFLPFITAVVLLGFPLALILAWAFEVTPDGVQRTTTAAPGEIERLVAAPASQRWPAGLLAVAGVAALVAGAWWVGTRTGPGAGAAAQAADRTDHERLAYADADRNDSRPSIAVLPFADMSPQSDQAYFSDGITEEILNTLVKVRELKVAARTSAFAFRGRDLDMRAIGDSLGVAYLIEGSVRKSGDRLRITAQLIDAGEGTHLWSESYDRTMDDVFAIQSEIAKAIASELRVPLGLDSASGLVTPTADLEAYDLYLAGRSHLRGRGAGLSEAVRFFEATIARDSGWAPAWAGLAEASELRGWYRASWEDAPEHAQDSDFQAAFDRYNPIARAAAERALALDPDNASAHVALGSVARNEREWEQAESEYRTALALDPDAAEVHQQYSEMLGNMGRIAEARRAAERAVRLDPAPIRLMNLAMILWADGRTDEALARVRDGIAADPDGGVPQLRYVWFEFNSELGRFDDAMRFGWPSGMMGEATEDEQARVIAAYRASDTGLYPEKFFGRGPMSGILSWMSLGRPDSALVVMRRAVTAWPGQNFNALWAPMFDSLRSEPGFTEVLERLNLAGAKVQRTRGADGAGTP